MKSIEVTKGDKKYIVKIERETVANMVCLAIKVLCDNENVMKHILDFSKHPAEEREQNMIKFSNHFTEKEALEWVDGYLEGKR